jgi:hypothetical protein
MITGLAGTQAEMKGYTVAYLKAAMESIENLKQQQVRAEQVKAETSVPPPGRYRSNQ